MTTINTTLKFRVKDDCKRWELPILRSGRLKIVRVKCKPPIQEGIRWHLEIEGEKSDCDRALELFASGNADIDPLPAEAYDKGDRVLFCSPPGEYFPTKGYDGRGRETGISVEAKVTGKGTYSAAGRGIALDIETDFQAFPREVVLLDKGNPEDLKPAEPEFNWRKSNDSLGERESLYFGEIFCGFLAYKPKYSWERQAIEGMNNNLVALYLAVQDDKLFFPLEYDPVAFFYDFESAKKSEFASNYQHSFSLDCELLPPALGIV
ncbi:MAG: hypothetical protein AAGA60_30285 [Cyanobacteria bacterium P01_E01_bin.42]